MVSMYLKKLTIRRSDSRNDCSDQGDVELHDGREGVVVVGLDVS